MAAIFINYRRADTGSAVRWLDQRLTRRYGRSAVFTDIDSIALGADFEVQALQAVAQAEWCLVAIGQAWLREVSVGSAPRIRGEEDLVRREIEAAMAARTNVIPLLFDGAVMPNKSELPPSIRGLAGLNALGLPEGDTFRLCELLSSVDATCASLARDALRGEIAKQLGYSWEIRRVESHAGGLRFITGIQRIESPVYYVMAAGIAYVLAEANGPVPEVREIQILNSFGVQGWVLEVPSTLEECQEMIGTSGQLAIAGRTHLFSRPSP